MQRAENGAYGVEDEVISVTWRKSPDDDRADKPIYEFDALSID